MSIPAGTNLDQCGPIAIVGSGEFLPVMAPIDQALLADRPGRVAIIPTAAGLEGDRSVNRWLTLGEAHYSAFGVETIAVRALDQESANDPANAAAVEGSGLIYFSGGDPSHVISSMRGTITWDAVVTSWTQGAALAGCSAGAMMMGSVSASPRRSDVIAGMAIFEELCVLPHFDRLDQRQGMTDSVRAQLEADVTLLGVDENTAVIVDPATGVGVVAGDGNAWLINNDGRLAFSPEQVVETVFRVS